MSNGRPNRVMVLVILVSFLLVARPTSQTNATTTISGIPLAFSNQAQGYRITYPARGFIFPAGVKGEYFNDFSRYRPGTTPKGWLLRGTTAISPIIEEVGGASPAYRLVSFPEVAWEYWDRFLIRPGMVLSGAYTVTTKLSFQNEIADRAGLSIAWNDTNWDRIDIQPNVYWDDIEFRVKYSGTVRSDVQITNVGEIDIAAFKDYWLRAVVKDAGPGKGTVEVYWSSDGLTFQKVITATGLASVRGLAGVSTAGPHMPHAHFDDFSARVDPLRVISQAPNDGWVIESAETSNAGGTLGAASTGLVVGDDAQDKQYRSILSFNTGILPDNAIIGGVTLRLKRAAVVGTDPFTTHGKLLVDVRNGAFAGNSVLQIQDFQAAASRQAIMTIKNGPVNGWYSRAMAPADFRYINRAGVTQFRLRFSEDDNDDLGSDYIKFHSGNALTARIRPQLIIQYYVP